MVQKARVKNQIQGLLGRLLIHSPYKLLWTKAGLAWLKDLELPAHERVILDSQLRQLASVKLEIELLDQNLEGVAQREPKVQLLMTIPGVDYVLTNPLGAGLNQSIQ
jgi:transposase